MPWKPPTHHAVDPRIVKRARAKTVLSRSKRGYTAEWYACSKAYLQKHPLCVRCAQRGEVVASEVTDHVIPHKGDMSLFWDENNWQALCKPCHDEKTASEDGGFGNPIYRSKVNDDDA
jgi:5-methylcytosine-specific restriction endonuclease McrA